MRRGNVAHAHKDRNRTALELEENERKSVSCVAFNAWDCKYLTFEKLLYSTSNLLLHPKSCLSDPSFSVIFSSTAKSYRSEKTHESTAFPLLLSSKTLRIPCMSERFQNVEIVLSTYFASRGETVWFPRTLRPLAAIPGLNVLALNGKEVKISTAPATTKCLRTPTYRLYCLHRSQRRLLAL